MGLVVKQRVDTIVPLQSSVHSLRSAVLVTLPTLQRVEQEALGLRAQGAALCSVSQIRPLLDFMGIVGPC